MNTSLETPMDTADTIQRLMGMYELEGELANRIIGVALPYAGIACTGIDSAFCHVVNSHRRGAVPLPEATIRTLGDLCVAVLRTAFEKAPNAAYLNQAFRLLGHPNPQFMEDLNYMHVLPAMWMLMPRLVEIQIASQAE